MGLDVGLAGKVISMLIIPSMINHVIKGMDFLCALGTTKRFGIAELVLRTVVVPAKGPGISEKPKEGHCRQEAGVPGRQPTVDSRNSAMARRIPKMQPQPTTQEPTSSPVAEYLAHRPVFEDLQESKEVGLAITPLTLFPDLFRNLCKWLSIQLRAQTRSIGNATEISGGPPCLRVDHCCSAGSVHWDVTRDS